MPGPVSDSFDPEWGISDNAALIGEALRTLSFRRSRRAGLRAAKSTRSAAGARRETNFSSISLRRSEA